MATTKTKKLDRRQIRTKRRIREALMALVAEKPLEKITIKELAERADIDRKTFYLHYGAISEVVIEMQEEMLGQLEKTVESYDLFQPDFDAQALFRDINSIVDSESEFYRRMLVMDRYSFFYERLKDMMKAYLQRKYHDHLNSTTVSRVKLELYMEYVATGVMSVYVHWLKHPEYSLDVVAEAASEIAYGGGHMVLESILAHGTNVSNPPAGMSAPDV